MFFGYLIGFINVVHYRAWTESTGHKFEDTWQEQQPIEIVLGKGTAWLIIVQFQYIQVLERIPTCSLYNLQLVFHPFTLMVARVLY